MTEAETGVMWTQAKDCWGHQQLEEEEGLSPGALGRSRALPAPWFQASGLQNRERTPFCFTSPSLSVAASGHLYRSHRPCLEEPYSDNHGQEPHPFDVSVALLEDAPDKESRIQCHSPHFWRAHKPHSIRKQLHKPLCPHFQEGQG